MRNDNCKNQNNQLPVQVAAVNILYPIIDNYFQENSLKGINGTLMELVSASVGPDPRSGKHSLLDITSTICDVRNTLNLIRKLSSLLVNEQIIHDYLKDSFFEIAAVSEFDIDHFDELLFRSLDSYIVQEDNFEDASLGYSDEITTAFKTIFDWLDECENWLTSINLKKGGVSC